MFPILTLNQEIKVQKELKGLETNKGKRTYKGHVYFLDVFGCLLGVSLSAFMINISIKRVTMLLYNLEIAIHWLYNEICISVNL